MANSKNQISTKFLERREQEKVLESKVIIDEETEQAYIDMSPILSIEAIYRMIMGERSNGKTYGTIRHAMEKYVKSGYKAQCAYVRRWDTDLKGQNRKGLCDSHTGNGVISEITNGVYDRIVYYQMAYYFAKFDEELNKIVRTEEPFMFFFALNVSEHYKSSTYPKIKTIIFDEFLTVNRYITDEFVVWMNFISTIVRKRGDVEIFMLANTVSRSSLYFREMGLLKTVRAMDQGTIQRVESKQGTTVAIEYCADTGEVSQVTNPADKYFGFDNPKLDMITSGSWQMAMYPHKPFQFTPKNVRYTFYVYWEYDLMAGQVVQAKDPETGVTCDFLYFSFEENLEISDLKKNTLIYTPEHSPLPNYRRKITRPTNDLERVIASYFIREKVFYEDNTTGDNITNYVQWCGNSRFAV